jgi:hypothetical protein
MKKKNINKQDKNMIIVVTHFWIPTKIKKIKKKKEKKPQNSVDTIPPCAYRCPRP